MEVEGSQNIIDSHNQNTIIDKANDISIE